VDCHDGVHARVWVKGQDDSLVTLKHLPRIARFRGQRLLRSNGSRDWHGSGGLSLMESLQRELHQFTNRLLSNPPGLITL
jgi:hypothetical protein